MLENWAKLSGFAAILAAVLSVSLLWALNYVPPQNTEWTCEAKSHANDPSKPALSTLTCHTKQSKNLASQPARTNKQGNQNSSDNIKTTDVLSVLFTGMLVIVTAVLIAVGISQANHLKQAVDASRDEFKLASSEFASTHRPKLILRQAFAAPQADGTVFSAN